MPSETFERLNDEKKTRILIAAQKEFTEKVYEEAKVINICKRADIPRMTFYSYFSSLADIYSYLYTILSQQYVEGSIVDCKMGDYAPEWEEYYMKLIESEQGLRILYESMKSETLPERMLYNMTMSLCNQYKLKIISRSEFIAEFHRIRTKLFEES